jgi:hypothetical protein
MQNRDLKPLGLPVATLLHRDLKVRAALEGRTMKDLLEEALRDLLAKPHNNEPQSRDYGSDA